MRDLFYLALEQFIANEQENIASDVSERNLCGRLAIYLDAESRAAGLDGYHVDPEYNRKQDGQVKTILNGDMQVVNITCDLILHSRGYNVERDNLIAIEMKKSIRPDHEKIKDRVRLIALTKTSYDGVWSYDGVTHPEHVCGYELGIFIEVDVHRGIIDVQEFERGKMTRNEQYAVRLPTR